MKHKKRYIFPILLVALLALAIAYSLWFPLPFVSGKASRSVVWIENRYCFALTSGGPDTVYFSGLTDSVLLSHPTTLRHQALVTTYGQGCWYHPYGMPFTCHGHLLTSPLVARPDTLLSLIRPTIGTIMDHTIRRYEELYAARQDYAREFAYYIKIHSPNDEGYQQMVELQEHNQTEASDMEQVLSLLNGIMESGATVQLLFQPTFHAHYVTPSGLFSETPLMLHRTTTRWHGRAVELRTADHRRPEGTVALFRTPFSPLLFSSTDRPIPIRQLGLNVALPPEPIWNHAVEETQGTAQKLNWQKSTIQMPTYPCAAGCPIVDQRGALLTLAQPQPLAYAGDSVGGQRHGWGILSHPDGRKWTGAWKNDTLPYGRYSDSVSTYSGDFNRLLQREGYGISHAPRSDEIYYGQWQADRQHGFGIGLSPEGGVACGWWRNGRFLGERLQFSEQRVYGIDISHYQHGGRPRGRFRGHPINWNQLRITSLGANNKNRIDQVDYPISFCYMKSTQGVTLTNPYYVQDAFQARRRNIRVGAYHFMSPLSGKEQAEWFLKNTPIHQGDLPPVLDVELSKKQIQQMGGDSVMCREMLVWLHEVEAQTSLKPILYVSQNFVNLYLKKGPPELLTYNVWIARYSEYIPHLHLLYWQLTPKGRVRGIRGYVDINVFNGNADQYEQYLASGFQYLP
ncbi:MAG: hypothetical protein IJ244_06070 [Bacteroidaceae bacterium]|nr:hypothetical protein [Bacteroidaceae bacterium]